MPNWFFEPLTKKPREMADAAAEDLDPALGPENKSRLKSFLAGALQGSGDVASDMTSPFSLATMLIPALARARSAGKAVGPTAEVIDSWGPMQRKVTPRLPEAPGASANRATYMPKAKTPIGPSASEEAGKLVNRMDRTSRAMERIEKVNAASRRSRRMRPGRFNEE